MKKIRISIYGVRGKVEYYRSQREILEEARTKFTAELQSNKNLAGLLHGLITNAIKANRGERFLTIKL